MSSLTNTKHSFLNASSKPVILSLVPKPFGDLDPVDSHSIFGLWTVFSKCAESIENGRRLENISWRLWNRELLYSPIDDDFRHQHRHHSEEKVDLTSSVPGLDQVPKLISSSDDSLRSNVTKANMNNRGSDGKKKSKQFSSEQLQQIFKLLDPKREDEREYWEIFNTE